MTPQIQVDSEQVADFCRRWKIAEMSLFGSVLREDFGPQSDVDVLVRFAEGAEWSILDHVTMQEELAGILGRKVDLVSLRGLERSRNWIRRRAILRGAQRIYAA
jgi:uncharacterized protein